VQNTLKIIEINGLNLQFSYWPVPMRPNQRPLVNDIIVIVGC